MNTAEGVISVDYWRGIEILVLGQEHAGPLLQHGPKLLVQLLVVKQGTEGGQELLVHDGLQGGVDPCPVLLR